MSEEVKARFSHRMKTDGTMDSICLACLGTISSQASEAALVQDEAEHVCRFAFPARRSGKLPAGIERGRRKSDAEWEKHVTQKA